VDELDLLGSSVSLVLTEFATHLPQRELELD
jgi:hypothetical protein